MSQPRVMSEPSANARALGRSAERLYTFGFSAILTMAIAVNTYSEALEIARLATVLAALVLVQAVAFRRLLFSRELGLYSAFFGYMVIELLWTPDVGLSVNTMAPAFNFILILILFSTLAAYHDIKALLLGALCGLAAGAAGYTLTQGFPFSYPPDFSYNAIAGMYLFGLLVATMLSCYTRASLLLIPLQLLFMLLIVATTSIKTNLGIILGVTASGTLYFRRFVGVLRRHLILLAVLLAGIAYFVISSDRLMEKLEKGFDRVTVGVSVLQAREDQPGYTGYEYRSVWKAQALKGAVQNPVFGFGVEAFRFEFGITSHSTPIDLLYNSGLIGVLLFYGLFVSVTWRLFTARRSNMGSIAVVIFGALVCYSFITLSATMHTNTYLAAFFAIASQLIERYRKYAMTLGGGAR